MNKEIIRHYVVGTIFFLLQVNMDAINISFINFVQFQVAIFQCRCVGTDRIKAFNALLISFKIVSRL